MNLIDEYVRHLSSVKRYSPRTVEIYSRALKEFAEFAGTGFEPGEDLSGLMTAGTVRGWEVDLLDRRSLKPRTVDLMLSVLSGFCHFLMGRDLLGANPVTLVKRPKVEKRLPVFYQKDAILAYLEETRRYADGTMLELYPDGLKKDVFEQITRRQIISILYGTGIRRAELISLTVASVDQARKKIRVLGKGDKMREIPLISSLCEEISLYLKAVESMTGVKPAPEDPLLVTAAGGKLYPVYVDRAVKMELGGREGLSGRKSPHVLRHTLATELMEDGGDLNSIKELLGHSSLAATQVYTHNSIAQLKKVYQTAHPRASINAKNGGKNGD